mmetsp:Transcript_7375/g.16720  ORF Transcript_7375/g.16720 Transcript_7375/m.16720 type:complete len:232 (+) Transcript_7375:160-855(+)|eukprot:CAMPEP_0172300864 /NCGR_PEP_ID=MMETSP1058-20130122/2876_1 /TAXON_ID=83371 /ORGANISM="Detonula confervacea, Strain CCMP 353" /LENGTH=231 /DNA_ID=CAMNT_0013010793 /DNA_START=125 /DNA_END=820 /DNA_ORIENTATION=-
MLRCSHFLPFILAFQSTQRIPSAIAFSRAHSVAEEHFQRRTTITAKEACSDMSSIEGRMSSDNTQQLFGNFKISSNQIFFRSEKSFAMVNLRPLVPGHVLICSNRVIPLLSDLEEDEYDDFWRTVRVVQKVLKQQYECDAFNVAVQDGASAGQSVPHVHVHILPRYGGDLERNDDIYDQLEAWAPRDEMISKEKPKLDVPEDSERRDRTIEEMAQEAAIYQSLICEQKLAV